MTITAKFASICPCCNVRIVPGSAVEWSKGSSARHVTCASSSSTRSAPAYMARAARTSSVSRRSGKWTGCRCGSREDSAGDLIPARNNCKSCEHDA